MPVRCVVWESEEQRGNSVTDLEIEEKELRKSICPATSTSGNPRTDKTANKILWLSHYNKKQD